MILSSKNSCSNPVKWAFTWYVDLVLLGSLLRNVLLVTRKVIILSLFSRPAHCYLIIPCPMFVLKFEKISKLVIYTNFTIPIKEEFIESFKIVDTVSLWLGSGIISFWTIIIILSSMIHIQVSLINIFGKPEI